MLKKIILLLFSIVVIQQTVLAQEAWYKKAAIYQIYPRSFYDTNGDGIGDINGIIEKLDYIQSMGFQAIWISPFFSSPKKDFGYDISDYYNIAPEYGTMQDCERLISAAHKRNLKVIFDLVMNHTSDEHEWFKTSASSKENNKADWYVWKDGKGKNGKQKPNNWKAMIGGSGWHWHEGRKQFYWSSFLPFQPDLNYHNPEVKQAMLNVAKHWLQKGVDGFRLDIFNAIYEDESMKNNPFSFKIVPSESNPNGFFQKAKYNINHEKSFQFATEFRQVIDSFQNPERYLIGEVFGDNETLKKFCNYNGKGGLNTVFLFKTLTEKLKAKPYRKMVAELEKDFREPFTPVYVYSNHDRKRSISRLDGNIEKAKLLAMFQFTVRGIPYTYYGEEIGMTQSYIPLKQGLDPLAQRFKWMPQFLANMSSESINRDECRTPMQWTAETNAGFTNATPWLPVNINYTETNVKTTTENENSLLNFYKKALKIRNNTNAFQNGILEIDTEKSSKRIFAFYRLTDSEKYLIVLNMSKKHTSINHLKGKIILSTRNDINDITTKKMRPYEGRIVKISE
jgi:oligo-1,6-glucosidase/alpha-glucosidase